MKHSFDFSKEAFFIWMLKITRKTIQAVPGIYDNENQNHNNLVYNNAN